MLAKRTELAPPAHLPQLQNVEREGGRVRDVRWGPRTIDLDIVKYETTTWTDADLVVPHVEITNRPFWQRELAEIEHARATP
jgi:2-amino-4-hydroxy-6-hydroxymethyldihydropteridine diphosphokinase